MTTIITSIISIMVKLGFVFVKCKVCSKMLLLYKMYFLLYK